MDDVFKLKKALRAQFKKERDSLTSNQVEAISGQIISNLTQLPEFKVARTIHTYVAWQNEVNTQPLIDQMLKNSSRVVLPLVAESSLRHFEVRDLSALQPGAFGILEPDRSTAKEVQTQELDLVLVPALAFDKKGYRLGYGGGYYDDFLKDVSAIKVGPIFDFLFVDQLPVRKEDEPVDIVVTENGVFRVPA